MQIIIQNFGKIPDEEKLEIQSIMKEFYQQLKSHDLELIDLTIFENSSLMEAYSRLWQDSLGVVFTGSETGFIASHEVWTGIPRILVCLAIEKIRTDYEASGSQTRSCPFHPTWVSRILYFSNP